MDDGVKSCGECQRMRWSPGSPGKHALNGCLWRGIAQGRTGCAPSFQVCVRWEMSAVQGGSRHSWPREVQGSHLGPERQRLRSLPSFCLAVFMSLHLNGHQSLQFGSRTYWSVPTLCGPFVVSSVICQCTRVRPKLSTGRCHIRHPSPC